MTLTPEQIEARRKHLGASEVAAVLGLDPYKRAADIWAAKRYNLAPDSPSEAAEFGSDIEPVLVAREAKKRRWISFESQVFNVAANGILAATHDALEAKAHEEGIEAKSSGVFNERAVSDEWGTPESDQVPRHVLIQVAAQLICCPSLMVVYIPALLGGRGPCSFVVRRDGPGVRDLCSAVEEQACEAWRRAMVLGMDPPADQPPPSLEVLRRIRREPKSVIEIDGTLYQQTVADREAAKSAQAKADASTERLIASLGTAEAGTCEYGTFSYREENAGARVDAELLRAKFPDVAKEVSKATTRMMPRFKVKDPTK